MCELLEKISYQLESQQSKFDDGDMARGEDVGENQPINLEVPLENAITKLRQS